MKAESLLEQVKEHCSALSLAVMVGQQLEGGTGSHWSPHCPSFPWEPGHIHPGPGDQEQCQLPEARVIKGTLTEFLKQRKIFFFKKGSPLASVVAVEGLFICTLL